MINFGLGLFLILIGFLVKKYPDLIAGYNSLSEEQKRNVDIDGLSTLMRNSFIGMGLIVAVLPHIFIFLGWKSLADSSILIGVLGVLPFLLIKAQKYDHNTKNNRKTYIVLIIVLIISSVIGGAIVYGIRAPHMEMKDHVLTISGMYGLSEPVEQMKLLSVLPKIKMKTNGFNFGEVRKGNFNLEDIGSCKLFLQSSQGPFILIRTTSETQIIINAKLPKETKTLYERMKDNLE